MPAVLTGGDGPGDPLLDPLPVVEAAALHTQTLEEAPANVTVITASEIARYGYRTLGEALGSVRGFYRNTDRMFEYMGVRGFSLTGDFNTRFLVMVNGHTLTDNVYGANLWFGHDFPIDMNLVERIEVVRGPSSALYGTNGIFATINVVTRSPVESPAAAVMLEAGSYGFAKAQMATSVHLGRGANLLVAGSLMHSDGRDLFFPQYNVPQRNFGRAIGMDGERAFHGFLNFVWGDWNFQALSSDRVKQPPLGFDSRADHFQTRGNWVHGRRGLYSLVRTKTLGDGSRLRFRATYHQYLNGDRFDYPVPEFGFDESGRARLFADMRRHSHGDWVELEATWRRPTARFGTLTLGTQGEWEIQARQRFDMASPVPQVLFNLNRPDRAAAVFAQQEKDLSRRWKMVLGLRYDESKNFSAAVSPRAAVLFTPRNGTVLKAVYGHPFRNPTSFEQYYEQPGLLARAAALEPESADTLEASVEQKLAGELRAVVNVYIYRLDGLIQGLYLPAEALFQFANTHSVSSRGVEMEIAGKYKPWLDVQASLVLQRGRMQGAPVVGSPERVAHGRIGVPLLGNRWNRLLWVSGGFHYQSSQVTGEGNWFPGIFLTEATISTQRLHPQWEVRAGVRNAANRNYVEPLRSGVPGDGRTLFVTLAWRSVE